MSPVALFDSLLNAIYTRNQEEVEQLIRQGADINRQKLTTINIDRSTYDASFTPLMFALRIGNLDAARALLKTPGIDVNAKDEFDGGTALMDAAKGGYADLVRSLLALGADVNAENGFDQMSAPAYAIQGGHAEAAEILIRADGLDLKRFGGDLLKRATWKNNTEVIGLLLELGVPAVAKAPAR